jgi:hypothetical protein
VSATITLHARAKSGCDAERQQNRRKRHQRVHHAHHERIKTAILRSQNTEGCAKQPRNKGHHETNPERHARPVEHAGENIPTEIVRAEGKGGGRRLETETDLHAGRIDTCEKRRKDRSERQDHDERQANLEGSVPRQSIEQHKAAPRRKRSRDHTGRDVSHSAREDRRTCRSGRPPN